MKKYKVIFEQMYNGKWEKNNLSFNGKGFNWDDALYVVNQLKANSPDIPVRNIEIIENKKEVKQ